MKDIMTNKIYGAEYCKRTNAKLWRFQTIPGAMKVIYDHFKPESVIDIGCANGLHLKALKELGVDDLYGIEGTVHWSPYIEKNHDERYGILDLRKPMVVDHHFDLVLSLEVLEHLEKKYARQAVMNILSFGKVFCISACSSGGGHYHVNPQPKEFWVRVFEKQGAKYCQAESEHLQRKFDGMRCSQWFKNNLKVFRK